MPVLGIEHVDRRRRGRWHSGRQQQRFVKSLSEIVLCKYTWVGNVYVKSKPKTIRTERRGRFMAL